MIQLMKSQRFLMAPPLIAPEKTLQTAPLQASDCVACKHLEAALQNQTGQTHGSSPTCCKQTPDSNHRVFMVSEQVTLAQPKLLQPGRLFAGP